MLNHIMISSAVFASVFMAEYEAEFSQTTYSETEFSQTKSFLPLKITVQEYKLPVG